MKLRLGPIENEKPTKVTLEIPAPLFRDLALYAELLGRDDACKTPLAPERLIIPMLTKFISGDRVFARAKREHARSP